MSRLISIEQVVSSAMQDLGQSDAPALRFQRWCNDGVRDLNCQSIYDYITTVIDVEDHKVELPCNFVKLVGAMPYNATAGCPCDDYLYVDYGFVNECGIPLSTICRDYCNFFQIYGGYIHLPSTSDATQIRLAYMGMREDENGLMIIEERFERALTNYIKYMFASTPKSDIDRSLRQEWYGLWVAQKNMLIGQDTKNQFDLDKEYMKLTTFNRVYISEK